MLTNAFNLKFTYYIVGWKENGANAVNLVQATELEPFCFSTDDCLHTSAYVRPLR